MKLTSDDYSVLIARYAENLPKIGVTSNVPGAVEFAIERKLACAKRILELVEEWAACVRADRQ